MPRGKYKQGAKYESAKCQLDVWASVMRARAENAGCPTMDAIFSGTERWVVAWQNESTRQILITHDYQQNPGEGWTRHWDARVRWPNTTNAVDHQVIHVAAHVDQTLRKDPDHDFLMACLLTQFPRSGVYEVTRRKRGTRHETVIKSETDRAIKMLS